MLLKPGTTHSAYIHTLTSWRTDWEGDHLALSALLCSMQHTQCEHETKVWVQLRLWIGIGKSYVAVCERFLSPFEKILKNKA